MERVGRCQCNRVTRLGMSPDLRAYDLVFMFQFVRPRREAVRPYAAFICCRSVAKSRPVASTFLMRCRVVFKAGMFCSYGLVG
jgi:hypothetical protein